jgi:predicted HTH transcriptional regulator
VVGIRNGTHELEGVSAPALVSWDQTTIFEALQRHASPTPALRVERAVIDGKSYVSIEVQEFAEIPTVCQLEGLAKSGNRAGDLILRRGALYIRTDGAQTVEMDNESLTRDLIARAMNRKGDHLLGQIANLIAPPKEPTAAPVDAYQSDREAARKAFNA